MLYVVAQSVLSGKVWFINGLNKSTGLSFNRIYRNRKIGCQQIRIRSEQNAWVLNSQNNL